MKRQTLGSHDQRLLQLHRQHLGLYARVGKKTKVTPSYVSRIARGQRTNSKVMNQLIEELRRLR
jgi:hypothetical protein